MRIAQRILLVAALAALALGVSGCNKLKARDRLNKGVQAYKQAKYEDAIERFKEAVELDPQLKNAKLYLATAYAQQFIPGVESPENMRTAELAIEQYSKVLENDPRDLTSLKGIASLYFNMKKFDKSKEYHRKVLEVDPNDPETYYSIAVIDWTESYALRMEKRAGLGLQPTEALKDKKVCAELVQANSGRVEEGIDLLKRAIDIRPDYDDAMAYLNLLYREKADYQCENPEMRADLLKMADEMVEKTMAVKQKRAEEAEKHAPGGVTLDQ
jgi:tetratricopeptide (TPR) repeat protein